MSSKGKESTQRLLAIIVIIAMLSMMGIPPPVLFFFAIVTYFVWRAVQHSEDQETAHIFRFYLSANEILRDEERRWYGFEIAEVIERGERVLDAMPDPPPLVYFALGALNNYIGHHEAAVEQLSFVVENAGSDERQRVTPSPELRRYVKLLRKLETDPAEAPKTLAAVRSLDRIRRSDAASLLAQSRERLKVTPALAPASAPDPVIEHASRPNDSAQPPLTNQRQGTHVSPPPPITDVLRDLYEEEKKTA